mmetsp:Transcript_25680/g.41388  ORF Transcript_25680/g.41388 Transcript_25680/m.41388 type:complete len:440 (+) Transcript_25680:50-1369(+)
MKDLEHVYPECEGSDRGLQPTLSSAVLLQDEQAVRPENLQEVRKIKEGASWLTVGSLQIQDTLGVGMLAIGSAFTHLGWVLGFVFCALFAAMCVYLAILQWQCQNVYPSAYSQTSMAKKVFNKKWFTITVALALYMLLFLVSGSYLLALKTSIKAIFVGHVELCDWVWCLISAGILLPSLLLRNLSALRVLVKVSCTLLVIVVLLVVGFVISELARGQKLPTTGTDVLFVNNLTLSSFFSGVSNLCFAFCGLPIFLEMSAEMKNRADFPKSFYVSIPVELGLFSIVATVSYLYQGTEAESLLTVIPEDFVMSRIVNVFLFFYMLVAYLVKSIIITRAIHIEVWPHTVDSACFFGGLATRFFGRVLTRCSLYYMQCYYILCAIARFYWIIIDAIPWVPVATNIHLWNSQKPQTNHHSSRVHFLVHPNGIFLSIGNTWYVL